ncbi:MAG: hypothetical protein QOJ19_4230 [Acidimicrobiia bacterium]|nr:hypothetical protein [Acidimicrobiia bacterium]
METRARVVLAACDGAENLSIVRRVGIAPHTVIEWRRRSCERGIDGLADR